jgi:tRNA threonylcarbamoyladenosine biosynthesis protein TsaE
MRLTYNIDDISKTANIILKNSKNKNLFFYGKMGAGKTTLIKEICKQLGVEDNINSPTFSLVNEYHSNNNLKLFHFDFYRIENEEEVLNIGIDDYFNQNALCLVEWPQNVENLLPLNRTEIHILILDKVNRSLEIKNYGTTV